MQVRVMLLLFGDLADACRKYHRVFEIFEAKITRKYGDGPVALIRHVTHSPRRV